MRKNSTPTTWRATTLVSNIRGARALTCVRPEEHTDVSSTLCASAPRDICPSGSTPLQTTGFRVASMAVPFATPTLSKFTASKPRRPWRAYFVEIPTATGCQVLQTECGVESVGCVDHEAGCTHIQLPPEESRAPSGLRGRGKTHVTRVKPPSQAPCVATPGPTCGGTRLEVESCIARRVCSVPGANRLHSVADVCTPRSVA